jgi:exoribonuclease R
MLYCKSLNVSIQSFTKDANREIKQHDDIIDSIIHMYSIPVRKANVFTIDSPGSIDLDDAISFCDNTVSVYITHVPIIMDYLNLWNSFTNRISTIYLPDKKRSMLPNTLSQLCSLNEGQQRICLVMDYNLVTLKYTFSICAVKVRKNYVYTDDIVEKDYQELASRLSIKKPNELITKFMILFNTNAAFSMKHYKNGIYKKIVHDYDFMKHQATGYELYNDEVNYMHITSPIRRLIDILNMTQLTINTSIYSFSNKVEVFYKKWSEQLDYMNVCFKNIKKVQNQCNLLSIFEIQKHQVFKGYVYDKIVRADNKCKYQVHIYDLNINYDLTILEDLEEAD